MKVFHFKPAAAWRMAPEKRIIQFKRTMRSKGSHEFKKVWQNRE